MTGDSQSAGRLHPLVQLVRARLLEFVRQPEAVFWVYVFPLLMMVALGIAFRTQPVEQFDVDVIAGGHADSIRSSLQKDERFDVRVQDDATARGRLRSGDVDLVIGSSQAQNTEGLSYDYYFDPTRPGSL